MNDGKYKIITFRSIVNRQLIVNFKYDHDYDYRIKTFDLPIDHRNLEDFLTFFDMWKCDLGKNIVKYHLSVNKAYFCFIFLNNLGGYSSKEFSLIFYYHESKKLMEEYRIPFQLNEKGFLEFLNKFLELRKRVVYS